MRSDRFDQIRPLLAGRADVVLADGLITAHYVTQLRNRAAQGIEPDVNPNQVVEFRRVFPPGPQRLYFRDEAVARDFDRCAAEMRASGELERIALPYVERYREILGNQYPTL